MDKRIHIPKWLKIVIIIILIIYIPFHLIFYGFHLNPCEYTVVMSSVPEKYRGVSIELKEGSYYVSDPSTTCAPGLAGADKLIITPDINIIFLGPNFPKTPIPPRTTFSMLEKATITKHGIKTIDSGPGPKTSYILKDANGVLYQLPSYEAYNITIKN